MNRSKVVLSMVTCLAVAVTLTITIWTPAIRPSDVHQYHVGDVVTDHWAFVGYYLFGESSSGLHEFANFNDNTQIGVAASFEVGSSNPVITLGNHTYVCTAYYAPSNWLGNDPSTITLKVEKN